MKGTTTAWKPRNEVDDEHFLFKFVLYLYLMFFYADKCTILRLLYCLYCICYNAFSKKKLKFKRR